MRLDFTHDIEQRKADAAAEEARINSVIDTRFALNTMSAEEMAIFLSEYNYDHTDVLAEIYCAFAKGDAPQVIKHQLDAIVEHQSERAAAKAALAA